jgi:hypothetical protein
MKKPTSCYFSLIILVSVLTPWASAQVNSAAQATMSRPLSPTAPNAAAISAQQAATASQRAADANTTVAVQNSASNAAQSANVAQSPINNNGAAAVTGSTAITSNQADATPTIDTSGIGETQSKLPAAAGGPVGTHSEITTKTTAQLPEQSTNSAVDSQIAADLNTPEITAGIRNASASTREALFRQLDTKIDTATAALRAVRRNSVALRGEARTAANESFKTVRLREQALRSSLKAARRASPDTAAATRRNWPAIIKPMLTPS